MPVNFLLELDLDKIKQSGKLNENENIQFRILLKHEDDDKIDRIVHNLYREISDKIDCTKCANCCKKLKPRILNKDIIRISHRLNLPKNQFIEHYTEKIDDEHHLKNLPCVFLKNNKCLIYEDRPLDCKSFPHLHKEDFISRLWGVIDNYSVCPIVFNVFEKLKYELKFKI